MAAVTNVVTTRGAGHGEKALFAELVAGEIGCALGAPVPALALATRLVRR